MVVIIGESQDFLHLPTRWPASFCFFEHSPKDPFSLGLLHIVLEALAESYVVPMSHMSLSKAGRAVKQPQVAVRTHSCRMRLGETRYYLL